MIFNPSVLLRELMVEALLAAQPERVLPQTLPADPRRLTVLAVGKAARGMMATAIARGAHRGLVIAPHGTPALPGPISFMTAAHPVPDAASLAAGQAALDLAQSLDSDDHLLVLLSGGASALMEVPVPGVTLAVLGELTHGLLASGARISEINAVRRCLSQVKNGGLLAAAAPAGVTTWAISDVPGDDPATIGSGPTWPATGCDAVAVLRRHGLAVPDALGWRQPPTGPGAVPDYRILASGRTALAAVAARLASEGWQVHDLGDGLGGPAIELAGQHADLARKLSLIPGRHAIISGGEADVRVPPGAGRGGRNRHFLLALALALGDSSPVHALAADTDGIDGTPDAAGAIITPDTLVRAAGRGMNARAMLDAGCSGEFFSALGDDIVTGPTGTNVNDIRIMLLAPERV